MSDIFLKIVNMSLSASWIVVAVLVLRFVLKKAPKWINGILWSIVGLRLVMPFSLESVFSLIPSTETISKSPDSPRPYFESGLPIVDNQVNDYLKGNYFEGVSRPIGNFIDITTMLGIVWIIGVAALLIYTAISYLRLRKKVSTAVLLRDTIFQSETVVSPFVLGIIKPRIYLPFHMSENDMRHVMAHEQAHIKRKDHWWKPLGFLLLTVYWFNPLMWLGYILLCRDIELACDEKVVKEISGEQRADYSQALLACSVNRRMIAACPLAFGEIGVKNRVRSVLNYKKPAFWISVVAVIVCAVTAVCFLTNPRNDTELKNGVFGVEKWYFDYVIGEDRANKEQMNWQIHIDDAGVVTSLAADDGTWVERGKLEAVSDPSVWELVKEKLPFYYRHLNVREAYAAIDPENGNATALFVTKNNLIFKAYIPSYGTADRYVLDVCKIKKTAALVPADDTGQASDNSETDQTGTSGKTTASTQIGTTTTSSSLASSGTSSSAITSTSSAAVTGGILTVYRFDNDGLRAGSETHAVSAEQARDFAAFLGQKTELAGQIKGVWEQELAIGDTVYRLNLTKGWLNFTDRQQGLYLSEDETAYLQKLLLPSAATTTTTIPQPLAATFTPIKAYTGCPQVQVSIKEIKQQDDRVIVVIEQHNQTDDELNFGAKFILYREEGSTMVDCCPENYRWKAIGYTQLANSTMQRTIDLSGFDVFVEGDYQLLYMFNIEGQQYRAGIEFSVTTE